MPRDRNKLRVTILVEDKRTERFCRKLLMRLGFRKLYFVPRTTGKGAAEAWVKRQYPKEVKSLRSKNYQRGRRLLTIVDGDNIGLAGRKRQLHEALRNQDLDARNANERIALLVPTWSIETWLLALLGDENLTESEKYKLRFEHRCHTTEAAALEEATAAWTDSEVPSLPALGDGKAEMNRIDP